MRLVALLTLAACAGATPQLTTPQAAPCPSAPTPTPTPVAIATPPVLDEATVIARSHDFMATIDKRDDGGFKQLIGPAFTLFESSRFMSAEFLLDSMARSREKGRPARTRTCKDEKVFLDKGAAVYVGDCTETFPAHEQSAEETWQGWNTVVWTPVGDAWKVAHWGWQKSGLDAEREMWNDTFRKTRGMKREPNKHLMATIRGRRPGTALDVAMGQGRNAVYLATQGWKTTGIDISEEGMRIAREAAAEKKVRLTTVEADMEKYDFGVAKWDLVTMIYAGTDKAVIEKIKPSIAKGGLFVVEYFSVSATQGTGLSGFEAGQPGEQFKGPDWKILVDEVVEDVADWARGKTKLVRFVAQRN